MIWPAEYINVDTGKAYESHNDDEYRFVYDNEPRHVLLKGGEGAGKSVAGIIKTLNRLRQGMDGIMVSPDLEHFKKSLWAEFVRWCPWECVIERHRYRSQPGWEPSRPFTMTFYNELGGYSNLACGGAKETEIESWEGPNVSFVHFDEARRHRKAGAIKVFTGRIRIEGPNGEPPQIFMTTTPRKHWLFDYFGPVKDNDPHRDFKENSFVGTVLTEENKDNLSENFVTERRQALTESEARVLLAAEWEDEDDTDKFVNIIWWDNCKENLPALSRSEPMVISLDAAKGSESEGPQLADTFAMVGVTRHPARRDDVAIRYCGIWQPQPGQLLDYEPIEKELIRLCKEFSVIEICYDPTQLHYFCSRLAKQGIGNFKEFTQQSKRLIADSQFQTMIASKRVAHDGNPLLRQHIDNANVKKYGLDDENKQQIRIIKRSNSLKVDAAVATSQGTERILYYNL